MKTTPQANRFLHIMLRVSDLKQSIDFYTRVFGLNVLRQTDYPEGEFTLAFLGYQEESVATVIELTHNWGKHQYEKGNAFGHLAFGVDNIYKFCESLKQTNINITRAPGPMRFDAKERIAFIDDPDGYSIELIERA